MVMLGTVAAGLSLAKRFDRTIKLDRRTMAGVVWLTVSAAGLLQWTCGREALFSRLLLSVVLGCLLFASITDLAMCQAYNFVWWISGMAASGLLWQRWKETGTITGLPEFLMFCALQLLLCVKLYGRADGYAFCVCAGAQTGLGMGMEAYFMHMTVAFILLIIVQAFRRNIGPRGRLKRPVPFLPYVAAGFLVMLIFRKICGEIVVSLS